MPRAMTSDELVKTQAERVPPPHDVTVPEPEESLKIQTDPKLILEVKKLAERVGGFDRLKELVEAVARFHR